MGSVIAAEGRSFMNVLLMNPSSPPSFWSFERSCKLLGHKSLIPPLGLITVAALLPESWNLRLVDLNCSSPTGDDWDWADLVMISGMIVQRDGMLQLIREARSRGKTVVVGGPYPTSCPEEVLAEKPDFLVRGEGENTVPLLIEALANGKPGGVFSSPEKPDMTESPTPRFDLLHLPYYTTMAVQTSRGCPFDCEFCDIVNLYGRKPRYKTPDQVMKELETLYRLGWRREIFLTDDNFIGNKVYARQTLERLIPWMKQRGEPFAFWCQASVNLGNDLATIDLMTEANFATVFVGVESPDEEVLELNAKYQNIRNPLIESLNNIKKNGLGVVASFVIGFDGELRGAGERIAAFVEQSDIPFVMLNSLQVLPNTRLWDRLKKEGRLCESWTSGEVIGSRLNYVPTRPESEIMKEYLRCWEYLYEPSRYLARAYRYFQAMRPTRRALALRNGTAPPPEPVKARVPLRERLRDVISFLRLAWWQGVKPAYRLLFWRQLLGMYRANPSRLVKYLESCANGENMFPLRELVRRRVAASVEVSSPSDAAQVARGSLASAGGK